MYVDPQEYVLTPKNMYVDPQEYVCWLQQQLLVLLSRSQFADQDEQTREDMKKEKRRYSLLFCFPAAIMWSRKSG